MFAHDMNITASVNDCANDSSGEPLYTVVNCPSHRGEACAGTSMNSLLFISGVEDSCPLRPDAAVVITVTAMSTF